MKKIQDSCTYCCISGEEEKALLGTTKSRISPDLLSIYNDSAFSNSNLNVNEFKYFLPRYLDIIRNFDSPSHSFELSLQRLGAYLSGGEWEEKEIQLLNEFSEAFFEEALSLYPLPNALLSITDVLVMMWNAKFNMEKLLLIWEKSNSIESVLHFNDFISNHSTFKSGFKVDNCFASEELNSKMCRWLASTSVRNIFSEKIEFFLLEDSSLDENILDELNLSYEIIKANPSKNTCPEAKL